MRKNREEIFDVLSSHQKRIKSLGVKSLALFGSGVRGEMNSESDLDFLVECPGIIKFALGIDAEIVWDLVINKIHPLEMHVRKILNQPNS